MKITIRTCQINDIDPIKVLFYNTVHKVNRTDYTSEELLVWAPAIDNKQIDWHQRINIGNGFVALVDNDLVGFSTLDDQGFIDFMYIHHNFQRMGIASYLYARMELEAEEEGINQLTTYSSITALPFFEKMGFLIVSENFVERSGQKLNNYLMRKKL